MMISPYVWGPVEEERCAGTRVELRDVAEADGEVRVPETDECAERKVAHEQTAEPAEGELDELYTFGFKMTTKRFCIFWGGKSIVKMMITITIKIYEL